MSENDLPRLLDTQRKAFISGVTRPVRFRIEMLRALHSSLRLRRDRILDALYADMRKPPFEAFSGELGVVLNEISYATRNVRRWALPRRMYQRYAGS